MAKVLSDLSLLNLMMSGAVQPDDIVTYGIEREVPFRSSWTPWLRMVDIDRDGKLDLVRFGPFCRDEVFLNQGTRKMPKFDFYHTLSPIPLQRYFTDAPYGLGPIPNTQRMSIDVVDWDGDGGRDLLINGWQRFEVYLDRGPDADPRWQGPVLVCTKKGVLNVLPQAVPRMADWDGDGLPDLLYTSHAPDPGDPAAGIAFGAGGYIALTTSVHGTRSEFYFCRNIGTRGEPLFADPELLTAAGKPFGEYFHGFSCFEIADWDGDGDLDLIIGSADNGHLYLVENRGTLAKPELMPPVPIMADGEVIELENYVAPAVCDWNGDGKKDLVIGTRPGHIYLFENQSATDREMPELKSIGRVMTPAATGAITPIDAGVYPSLAVVDWDGDGVKDLIIGNEYGNIGFCRNAGGSGEWRFEPERVIKTVDGKPIWLVDLADGKLDYTPDGNTRYALYGYTAPAIADLNGDGSLDMLVSTQGPMLWVLYNAGRSDEPRMTEPELLRTSAGDYVCPCRVRPGLADFDGDGIPDMIHVDPDFFLTFQKGRRDEKGYFVDAPRRLLDENGEPIRLRPGSRAGTEFNQTPRTQLEVVDWDGDGRLDLLIGTVNWASIYTDCELLYLKNVGSNEEPVFSVRRMLIDGRPFIKPDSDHDISTATIDWNGDGVLDLLIANTEGWIFYYDGRRFSR